MNTRVYACREIVFLSVALVFLLLCSENSFTQEQTFRFTQLPRANIESRLRRVVKDNDERGVILKNMFMEAGCDRERLTEQPIKGRKQKNVICTLQGSTASMIVIGANFDHVNEGLGVVDNWSGSGLLPSLFESLKSKSLKHTMRFIGFAEQQKGLIGSSFFATQLSPDELMRLRLMVDLDSLGVGSTEVSLSHSDRRSAEMLKGISNALHLPLDVVNVDQVADDDSTPFRKRHVPTLMLTSVTQKAFEILHSNKDNLSQIDLDEYYDSYRLIDAYLTYVDQILD